MIRHYVTAALRGFQRHPGSTAIKLLVLALGFACFLTASMIASYVAQTDRQWANSGRIFTISQSARKAGEDAFVDGIAGAVSRVSLDYLSADFPDLTIAATNTLRDTSVTAGARTGAYHLMAVDPEFMEMFDLPMEAGRRDTALDAPLSVIVEAETARRLFGGADPMGQPLRVRDQDVTVTGVFRLPRPSHLGGGAMGKDIQLIVTRDTLIDMTAIRNADGSRQTITYSDNWGEPCCTTYLLLPDDGSVSRARLQSRLDDFARRRVPPEFGEVRYTPTSLVDIGRSYMNSQVFGDSLDLSLITVLNLFAALILAVACLDFANLATAEAAARARDIGLRKTIGATRSQVVAQTLVEVGLLTLAALVLVLPLTLLIVTPLGHAIQLDAGPSDLLRPVYLLQVLAVAAAVCVAAGAYPALVLSRIRPILTIRKTKSGGGAGAVRTVLIGAQFAAASFLLAAVLVMTLQKAELRGAAIPDADPRVAIGTPTTLTAQGPDAAMQTAQTLRTELLANPAIVGITGANVQPFQRSLTSGGAPPSFATSDDPAASRLPAQLRNVSADYFAVTGIGLLAGEDFSIDDQSSMRISFGSDTAAPGKVIVDERTAALLGYTPQQALGQSLYYVVQVGVPTAMAERYQRGQSMEGISQEEFERGGYTMIDYPLHVQISGVAANAPLEYMSNGPANYIYMYSAVTPVTIGRIDRNGVSEALAHIDATWRRLYPGQPIQRAFLDEAFDANFTMFNMLGAVFLALSAIAVGIAGMGMFGIASFVTQRRLREIGVRKTLGASTPRVLGLMLWDFSRPVIVANLAAWPLIWLGAQAYLNLFTRRIDLTPAPFAFALILTLLVAWAAVAVHAGRAARVKPATALRIE